MYLSLISTLIFFMPLVTVVLSLRSKSSPFYTVFKGTIVTAVTVFIVFAAANVGGNSISEQILQQFSVGIDFIKQSPELMQSMGLEGMTEAESTEALKQYYTLGLSLMPYIITTMTMVLGYIYYILISKSFIGKKAEMLPMPKFKEFSLPNTIVVGYFVCMVLAFIAGKIDVFADTNIYINVNFIFQFLFSLQAISFIFFWGERKGLPRIILFVGSLLIYMNVFGKMILFMVGILDILLDFKTRISQK